jgi:hypothetical protein
LRPSSLRSHSIILFITIPNSPSQHQNKDKRLNPASGGLSRCASALFMRKRAIPRPRTLAFCPAALPGNFDIQISNWMFRHLRIQV